MAVLRLVPPKSGLATLPTVRLGTPFAPRSRPGFEVSPASGPVVVLGPRCVMAPSMMTTLFLCVDGSPRSESVLDAAADLARAEGWAVWLVNVAEERSSDATAGQLETLHANYLRRLAHQHRGDGITYHWTVLHHSRPDRAIVDHVDVRGGVALTKHGASGRLDGLGPVAAGVVRHARVPVIVVPSDTHPPAPAASAHGTVGPPRGSSRLRSVPAHALLHGGPPLARSAVGHPRPGHTIVTAR